MQNLRAIIKVLPLVLMVSACATKSMEGGNLDKASNEAAEAAMNAGDPTQSAIIYSSLYERTPNAENAVKEARALRLSGNAQRAVLFLQDTAKKYPRDAQLYTELARSALAGGYMPEALQALTTASTLPGVDWRTWLVFGAYEARVGNFPAAQNYFNQAVSMAPNPQQSLTAQADVALLRAERGDISGAIADLTMLSNRPGADPRIAVNLQVLNKLQTGDTQTQPYSSYSSNRAVRRARR